MRLFLIVSCLFLCFGCQTSHKTVRIAATSVPHADLLSFVKEELKEKGIELKIIEVDDYNLPNRMLAEKQIEANFFQHRPFLDEQIRLYHYDLVPLTAVHLEPLGIYSDKYTTLEQVPEGAVVALPQDPTNEARSLFLLEKVGLIELKEGASVALATVLDVAQNPKKLRFEELDAPYLPRALPDVDLAVIPVNFALQAGLNPLEDALALEPSDTPYANLVVVRRGEEGREEFTLLKEALHSEKMRAYILEKYHGSILPAFAK